MAETNRSVQDQVSEYIHEKISDYIEPKITKAEEAIDKDVNEAFKQHDPEQAGKSQKGGGAPLERTVKDLRKKTLIRFKEVKNDLKQRITEQINRVSKIGLTSEIERQDEKITRCQTDIYRAENELQRISETIRSYSDYDKYLAYGGDAPVEEDPIGGDKLVSEDAVYSAVYNKYREFKKTRLRNIILGIIATLVFAAVDVTIIRSVFMASNLTTINATLSAILSAIVLDVPPYLLGMLLNLKNDTERVWFIRGEKMDPGARKNVRLLGTGIWFLTFTMVLFFSAYFLLRVLLFFGGGNFNEIMHSVLKWQFDFGKIEFNSSDLMSTFVPFATSAGAFAVSLMLSYSKADYIKAAVNAIKQTLEELVTECKNLEAEYSNTLEEFKKKKNILKAEQWEIYGHTETAPDDEKFFAGLSRTQMKLSLPVYEEVFIQQLNSLRIRAELKLESINGKFTPFSMDQVALANVRADDEEFMLDDICAEAGKPQTRDTELAIYAIQNQIKLIESIMKKDEEQKDADQEESEKQNGSK